MTDDEPIPRSRHRPVLLRETLRELALRPGLTVLDGTVGAGGHASAIWPLIQPGGRLIGTDRDPMMLRLAAAKLADTGAGLHRSSYRHSPEVLEALGLATVDRVLLDLGLSSDQLADRGRGFSFQSDGPLDLRFDPSVGRSAAELLAASEPAAIVDLLKRFGEEPAADAVAGKLHRAAKSGTLTAQQAAAIVSDASPAGSRSTHPATRVFQALRIAVNEELEHVRQMLEQVLPEIVTPGGRVAVISFHSLEDRLVKNAFRDGSVWNESAAKPISCSPSEERVNPRARTAKLRVAVRRG